MPPLFKGFLFLLAGATVLDGCTVGPNYRGAPTVPGTATTAASFTRAPKSLVAQSPVAARWWKS